MKKVYRYYITFFHSKGAGYCVMDVEKKIQTLEDVNNLIQEIETKSEVKNAVIYSWIKLRS